MTKLTKTLATVSLLLAAPLAFSCDYPAPPKDLPDGASASKEEMIAGVKVIAAYQEEMTMYLDCIEAEEVVAVQAIDDTDNDAKDQRKLMFDKKFNAAVDEQTRTVEGFNLEIREYKDRDK